MERFEHYFTANDIVSDEKRRAILLNAVGASTYRLIRTLVSPSRVTDFTFKEIVEKAQGHFSPKPSPIVKRYEFNTRKQVEDESVATYVAELRKIAEFCEYGPVLNDMLRDRLVCGTSNNAIQRRLLQETDLTFEKALEVASSTEAADKNAQRLTDSSSDKDRPALIGKVNDRPSPITSPGKGHRRYKSNKPQQHPSGDKPQLQDSDNSGKQCHRCGGTHEPATCPFKQYECHFCKKKGHLAQVCRKKDSSTPERAHYVGEEETSEYNAMFHVSCGRVKPLYVTVSVNGNPLAMEIDTGASVSIASLKTFESIRNGESILELDKSTVQLHTYTGQQIKVCGSAMVQARHDGQTALLPLIITEGNGPTLLVGGLTSRLEDDLPSRKESDTTGGSE